MNALKKVLSPYELVDEEIVNCSIPLSILQEDLFLLRPNTFMSEVVVNVSQGIINRSKPLQVNDTGKIWNKEKF